MGQLRVVPAAAGTAPLLRAGHHQSGAPGVSSCRASCWPLTAAGSTRACTPLLDGTVEHLVVEQGLRLLGVEAVGAHVVRGQPYDPVLAAVESREAGGRRAFPEDATAALRPT